MYACRGISFKQVVVNLKNADVQPFNNCLYLKDLYYNFKNF